MNPDTRELVQLTTNDMNNLLDLYSTLMGNSPSKRKSFIMKHAREYRMINEDTNDEGEE